MKLSKFAIESLNKKSGRIALMQALGFSEVWVIRCLEANKNNGPLTTYKALQVIREETGLTDEQILEAEVVEQK